MFSLTLKQGKKMPTETEQNFTTKQPKRDKEAFLTALNNNDRKTIDKLKALYQVSGGIDAVLEEEINWHATQEYFRENPMR
jgi:hypothetical protein